MNPAIYWGVHDSIPMAETNQKLSWWYAGIFFSTALVYILSCAPGALWQDSGLIQYRIWHNDVEGPLGLALSHPLFYIITIAVKYVPLGEFFYRINLVSAIAGAVTIANIFLLVHLWLDRNFPAVVAAVTLAVSHTFWSHAGIIETYTLWAAIFTTELIMLLQYTKTKRMLYLYWLGLLNGLAIAVHNLASIPFLFYAVFVVVLLVKKNIRFRDLAIIALLWILGALPYEYLIIKNIMQTGSVTGTLASAAFGVRWKGAVLNAALSKEIIKENLLFILLNFPTPNLLLFFVGLFGLYKISTSHSFRNILLGLIVLFFIFAFRYNVPDRYAFFLPFYCMVSIFIGLGAYLFLERINRKVFAYLILLFCILPACVYTVMPARAEKMQINLGTRNNVPYRNDYKYFLQPWKTGYRGAEHFADEALGAMENNAIIFADSSTVAPLLLMQEIKGKRPDVKVISGVISSTNAPSFNENTIEQLLQGQAVYVVSQQPGYCPSFVLDNYKLIPAGLLWRVTKKYE